MQHCGKSGESSHMKAALSDQKKCLQNGEEMCGILFARSLPFVVSPQITSPRAELQLKRHCRWLKAEAFPRFNLTPYKPLSDSFALFIWSQCSIPVFSLGASNYLVVCLVDLGFWGTRNLQTTKHCDLDDMTKWVVLSLPILFVPLASAWNPFSSRQQQTIFSPVEPATLPSLMPFPTTWARCPQQSQWKCRYSVLANVWCSCVPDEILNAAHEQTMNVTSLEVIAEVQPGNNDTLVSLFEMQCEEKHKVGCVSRAGRGFVCGCHQYCGDGAEEEAVGDYNDYAESEVFDSEEDVEELRLVTGADFRFRRFRYPKCNKPGYHIKCCSYSGKSHCFCAGTGVRCPR